ncbi:fungal-specific transcription factor domain-containing protein [Stachybotrys elegans]|uniref:Fungal-specific transcription factor domain-containing protein n=1 Tax=Stachybotrys elegans TaxID=80388 RepID=A0A8K0WVL7_9HYPO|nr:fungal-specific transcription factor domain-containing protein [Stachybotrys elegans]
MGRKPTACQKCAAIKAKCSGQAPCARCQRLGLPCSLARGVTDSNSTIPGPLSPAAQMVAARARHMKSSNGCANCRRRRKKCDERRPICGDCARLNLHCLPRSDQSLFEPLATSPTSTAEASGGAEISDESDDDTDVAPILNWSDIILGEIEMENCPQSLAHSSALKVLPDKRASDEAPPPEGITLPPIALSKYAGINPAAQDSWTAGERHLLNHFIQSVARSMSMVEDRYNPFIRLIAPKIFESKAIRNAVAALSATHLSKVYPDFVRNQLMHRDMALENLKAILEIPEEAAAALGATLILCLCEIYEGHSRKWLLYLHGARALLAQFRRQRLEPFVEFLVDLYNYICCIAPVTTKDVPRPFGKRFGLYQPGENGVHALFGKEPALYSSIARVNRIISQQLAEHNSGSNPTLEAAERELQRWSHLQDANSEHEAAAYAILSATVLRLREVSDPDLDIESSRIQVPVNNITSALSLIRPGSPAESHLLFPIFMAGVNSITKASRLVIEYRITVAERTIGAGTVSAVHRLLDQLWRRVNNGGKVLGWREIKDDEMPGCVLF